MRIALGSSHAWPVAAAVAAVVATATLPACGHDADPDERPGPEAVADTGAPGDDTRAPASRPPGPDAGHSSGLDVDDGPPPMADPGRVTLHRLNRQEYTRTVQDLLGTDARPADDFPSDDFGYGFDNIADVLSVSPLHLELWERAAEELAHAAMHVPKVEPDSHFFEAEAMTASTGGASGDAWNLWSNGTLSTLVDVEAGGTYRATVRAWGQQAGPAPPHMTILIDGVVVAEFDVEATAASPAEHQALVPVGAGPHELAVGFTNDYYEPAEGLDRNLIVDWVTLVGPQEVVDAPPPPNAMRDRVVTCDVDAIGPDACALEIVETFGSKAFRRPLTGPEVATYFELYELVVDDGGSFDRGVELVVHALLTSPHFHYRVERDPDPYDPTPHALGAYELASRLSYFLWSSMPDDELFDAAADGSLLTAAGLEAQTRRMLADPRSAALVDGFAGQWLYLRALDDAQPDPWAYPEWDEGLRDSMRAEAHAFVSGFLRGDRSMLELLTATETVVDTRLAEHYGLDPASVPGLVQALPGEMVPADVAGAHRGGLLRTGGWLTVMSYPTRTSPVRRGKWVLEQLLCTPPPPPPPGVEGLETDNTDAKTIREALEQHREDPACMGCHLLMDPIGLGLEHFDGIGRHRWEDAGYPIDASGTLAGARDFEDAAGLIAHLVEDPQLPHCMAEQLSVYALGRGPTDADDAYLEALAEAFVAGGHRFEELAVALVLSDRFRMRRAETADEQAAALEAAGLTDADGEDSP